MLARARHVRALLLAGICLCAAGCATVREEQKPLTGTTLVVTRAGGQTQLGWASQLGWNYTVLYAERRDKGAAWKVLPGADRLRGTGGPISFNDRVPGGQSRYYRLQATPAARSRAR